MGGATRRVRGDFLHGNERTTPAPQMGQAVPRPRSATGQAWPPAPSGRRTSFAWERRAEYRCLMTDQEK